MRTSARATFISVLVATGIIAGAAPIPPLASADSGDLQLSCTFSLGGGASSAGPANASFDTGIQDGLVVDVGEAVPLDPFTGTITFPDGLTDLLRAEGITTVTGELNDALLGQMPVAVDVIEDPYQSWLPNVRFGETAVPAAGSMSVDVTLSGHFTFIPKNVGTQTIVSDGFYLALYTSAADVAGQLACGSEEGPFVIDSVEVSSGATTTPPPLGQDPYSCTLQTHDETGTGSGASSLNWTTTASFDTVIPEGLVVDVGEKVSLTPFTGTITIPSAFQAVAGVNPYGADGGGSLNVVETDEEFSTYFSYGETAIPSEGPVSVRVKGTVSGSATSNGPFEPKYPGTYNVAGGGFYLEFDGGVDPSTIMSCQPMGGPFVIDTLQAVEAAEPTPTAVRPVVVQTDFAEDDAAVPPLLGVAAILAMVSGLLGLARARTQTSSRRH